MNELLTGLVSDVLGVDKEDVTGDLSREESELWDSMNHLRLITAIEEEFSIRMTMDEIQSVATLKELNSVVTGYLDKQ